MATAQTFEIIAPVVKPHMHRQGILGGFLLGIEFKSCHCFVPKAVLNTANNTRRHGFADEAVALPAELMQRYGLDFG